MAKRETMTTKTDQELMKLLAETRESLRGERFAAAGARPKDTTTAGKLRTTIARVQTEVRARALKAI